MTPLFATVLQLVFVVIGILQFIVIAHVIVSWLVNFQVLNLHQPLVAQIWYGLNKLVEPIYRPVRRFLPNLGGIDLAPLVVILVLFFLRELVRNYYYAFL